MDANAGKLDSDAWSLSAYGTYYSTDRFYLEGSLTYGWNQYDQDRNISYGLLGGRRTANADFDGNQFSALFGGGYDFHLGPGIFDLYGRVRYVDVDIDSYREHGAQGLDLVVNDQSATSVKSILGAQYSHAIGTAKTVLLPQVWLQWEHEFESSDDSINGFFANDPNRTAFALATDSFDKNILRLGLGLGAQFAEGRTGYLSYEAVLGSTNYTEHKFTAGLNLSF